MRNKEIIKVLFDDILKFTEIEYSEIKLKSGQVYKIAFLDQEQAIMGFTENRTEIGHVAFLKVWSFSCYKKESFHKNVCDMPIFQIMGGPFYGQEWDCKKGYRLFENIMAQYNNVYGFHNVEFLIDSPLFDFIHNIVDVAKIIQKEKKPAKLSYWQAFVNPGGNYAKKN